MTLRSPGLTLFLCAAALGCQYEDRCGKDDLVYDRGLCFPPPAEAGAPKPTPTGDAGASDAGSSDGATMPSKCEGACELIGRCIAENPMASGFLADQLTELGFSGSDRSGCVTYCDANSAGAGDEAVLTCLAAAEVDAMCDPAMLAGSLPAVQGVDSCCEGRADSEYCVAVCTALSSNPTAYGLVPSCADIAP